VLNQYPRESWHLVTKMPGHMMRFSNGRFEFSGYLTGHTLASPADLFEEQLEKCGVDYFDFYLLHNLCETSYDFYTDEDLGVVEYLLTQKKAGRIRHLGFSAHARAETIDKFLNWKDCFEFVQIQLNLPFMGKDQLVGFIHLTSPLATSHNITAGTLPPDAR